MFEILTQEQIREIGIEAGAQYRIIWGCKGGVYFNNIQKVEVK